MARVRRCRLAFGLATGTESLENGAVGELARGYVVNSDLHRAELLSVPVTLIVLLFAFGALVATIVPSQPLCLGIAMA